MDINELYNNETREGIYVDDVKRRYDNYLKVTSIRSMMKGLWTKVFHSEVRLETEIDFINALLKETQWVWNKVFPEMPNLEFNVETQPTQYRIDISIQGRDFKQSCYIERKPLSPDLTKVPTGKSGFHLHYNAPQDKPLVRRYSDLAPIYLNRWKDESNINLAIYQDLCKAAKVYQDMQRFITWTRGRYNRKPSLLMTKADNAISTTELVKGIIVEVKKLKEEFVVYRIDAIDLEGSCSFACLNDGSVISKEDVKDATNFNKLFDCLNSIPDEIKRETRFYVKKGLALSEFIEYVVHLLEKKKKELNLLSEEKEDE